MRTINSVQIVPTALTVQRGQSRITVGAAPSLPPTLDDEPTIRVEVCNRAREVVWHADYPAGHVREQLSGSAGAVTVEIPTADLSDGSYLLRIRDMRNTPFFMASLEVEVVD